MTMQPPDPVPPVDSTAGANPVEGVVVEQPANSVAAIGSLICGILFCIPILTGLAAIALGIAGIVQTREAKKRGRWMAIAGLLLGIASVGVWTLGGGTALVAYFYTHGHSDAPDAQSAITATNDFLRAISDDNAAVVEKHNGTTNEKELKSFEAYCKAQGSFLGTTVNASVNNNAAQITGTAQYSLRNQNLHVGLTYTDGVWKVTGINMAAIGEGADQNPQPAPAPGGGENVTPSPRPGGDGNDNPLAPAPRPTPAPAPTPTPAPQTGQPLTNGAVGAMQEFIRGLCNGDEKVIAQHNGGFSPETVQSFTDYFKPLGKLTGANFTGDVSPQGATVTGTAIFENGKQTVKGELVLKDAEWKVVSIDVHPVGQ